MIMLIFIFFFIFYCDFQIFCNELKIPLDNVIACIEEHASISNSVLNYFVSYIRIRNSLDTSNVTYLNTQGIYTLLTGFKMKL